MIRSRSEEGSLSEYDYTLGMSVAATLETLWAYGRRVQARAEHGTGIESNQAGVVMAQFDRLSAKQIVQRLGGRTIELPDDMGELYSALMDALTLDQSCDECSTGEHERLHSGAAGYINTLSWMIGSQSKGVYLSGPRDGEYVDHSKSLARVYQALPAFADFAAHTFHKNGDGAYYNSAVLAHRCFKVIFESLAGFAQDDETRRRLLDLSRKVL